MSLDTKNVKGRLSEWVKGRYQELYTSAFVAVVCLVTFLLLYLIVDIYIN